MSAPVNQAAMPRLTFIDSLRGFALFGVFGANLFIFSGLVYMTDDQKAAVSAGALDRLVTFLELFLVENKFMGLFSILFGISFWLFLDRARTRGGSAIRLFFRRIGWLFAFGALHGWLLWAFDILRFYALWALLLPLFIRTPPRRLLTLALLAGVVGPAAIAGIRGWLPTAAAAEPNFDALALAAFSTGSYPDVLRANWAYDWYLTNSIGQIGYQLGVFGRLLLGLCVARALNLTDLAVHRSLLHRILLAGTVVGAIGNGVFASPLLADARGFFLPFGRRLLVESGHLGFTLAFACALALLSLRARWQGAVTVLAPIGQMALTIYLLQTVFGILLFYGFAPGPRLMGEVGPAALALIWVVGFALQVILARAWMQRFRYGPMEWLWRTLTYWRVQPLRAAAAPREAHSPRPSAQSRE